MKRIHKIAGWLVFGIAVTVYFFSAERTGSLWDCGEFILGAYKLQVVHPPGAPFFLLIGRLFTWVADIFSDNPEDIAFAVNLMSGVCTAFAAMFICMVTIMLGKLALAGRERELTQAEDIAAAGAGVVAGLATAFATSIWFSAVEGEVYAMSTFFTTLTLWSMIKWYSLPDTVQSDRWLFFTIYVAGLSIGVHLLSILTFPALAMFYYFKKYKEHTWKGVALSAAAGALGIAFIQKVIIVGIPKLWSVMELMLVNGFGLPFHSGLVPTLLIVGGVLYAGLYFAHKRNSALLQSITVAAGLLAIAFSTIGVVVIRANADPPVNMNRPSDAVRLIPYLNREQYGERALLSGPSFEARPEATDVEDRYGRVGDHYEYTDYKIDVEYKSSDKMLFPRMGDGTQGRPTIYKQWMGLNPRAPLPAGRPNQLDNLSFLLNYQIGWMYWRYFMWNFSGRQNGEQGFYPWDKSSGHWLTGIKFLDAWRLGNQSELPEEDLHSKARNTYFALPFLFGLFGLFFHFRHRNNDALGLLALFIITGLGIIIYSNQPPNEPRERDYVLAGSFFTYCIWIGMGVLAIFRLLQDKMKTSGQVAAALATAIVLSAPLLMGFQNFDDHTRREIKASRDYAHNFLESCAPNAIIFTYGDNDTYPLWYAQEVEGIRTDVRVVNLSLIAVDWYIDLLRRKVNDSPAIKMTIPRDAYRGKKRNQIFYVNQRGDNPPQTLESFLTFLGEYHPVPLQGGRELESYYSTKNVFIAVDKSKALASGAITEADSAKVVSRIPIDLSSSDQLIKDEIAILDVISSNLWERPIYFAVTCRQEKLMGLGDYTQLEGLGLRIVPIKSDGDPQYGILGNGRVNKDVSYDAIINKFRWGNFDQKDLFVDRSYAPSVQSIQLLMRRTAFSFIEAGDNDKAVDLANQYFKAFPNMNFPYDYRTSLILDVYFRTRSFHVAKPHLEILAENLADRMEYYLSLDKGTLDSSYSDDLRLSYQTIERLIDEAERAGDTEFLSRLTEMFKPYLVADEQIPNPELPIQPEGQLQPLEN